MSEGRKRNKGWDNLQGQKYSFANMDREKLREITRKGAEKTHQIVRARKTAKECLKDILSLEATDDIIAGAELPPEIAQRLKNHSENITMYDLIHLVAVGLAAGGNMRAIEYLRDTCGEAPVKQLSVDSNIMTMQDRELLETISKRLNDPDITIVADVTNGTNDSEEGQ